MERGYGIAFGISTLLSLISQEVPCVSITGIGRIYLLVGKQDPQGSSV
jgi:hypothetical protein